MKKTILINILCLFTLLEYTSAQEQCGTFASQPPEWIFKPSTRAMSQATDGYIIRIFVHLIQNQSGQGAKSNLVQECQQTLNRFYAHLRVQFEVIGYEILYKDEYYLSLPDDDGVSLSKINNHPNAIDIYVLPGINNWDKNGNSFTIPSTLIVLKELGCYNTTLAHEMGHCLGLYHTHHGTIHEGGLEDNQCAELVNGSNSSTCGDYIEDTPADPKVWSNCFYSGNKNNLYDANGQSYHPDPTNIMAYSSEYCRDNFTPKQEQRMRDFIVNTPELMNTVMNGFALSGYNYLDRSEIFNVTNLPAQASVRWQINSSDFRVINMSTGSAQVLSCKYNSSAQLKASVYYNDVLICELTRQIFSSPLTIQGDTYLSAREKRYTVNFIPYGGRLTWSVAPGMVIKEKGTDYIVVTADKAVKPWLRATVAANGTTTVKELKLRNEQLAGATLECLKTWRGTYEGQSRKKYAFRVRYTPATIPVEDLTFCWSNTVQITGPDRLPQFILLGGQAQFITEGNIGFCDKLVVSDSVVFRPVRPATVQTEGVITNPNVPDEDMIPILWEHSSDHAVAIMPRIDLDEESSGFVSCNVADATGKTIKVKSPGELFDQWQPVYHVSPNPATGLLTVTRENVREARISGNNAGSPEVITVNLFSNAGLTGSVSGNSDQGIRIDTSGLPDGNYTLTVLEEGKTVHSQVVIIKH